MSELVWHERTPPTPYRRVLVLEPADNPYNSDSALVFVGVKEGAYFIDRNKDKYAYVWEPLDVNSLEEAQAVALALYRMGG